MNDIGYRIRERRIALGYTQQELAEKVGYKSKVSINKIENCRDLPIKKVKPIADALEIPAAELMGWVEEPAKPTPENAILLADIMSNAKLLEYVRVIKDLPPQKQEMLFNYVDFLKQS